MFNMTDIFIKLLKGWEKLWDIYMSLIVTVVIQRKSFG